MNKQLKKQIIPLCILVSVLIFIGIVFSTVKPLIEEFNNAKNDKANAEQQARELEEQDKILKEKNTKEEMKLRSIKQIYETNQASANENLGMFGNMFEDIIKRVKYNGLLIRSIEYDLKPAFDPLYQKFPESYNACELKFFLVGTYSQLQTFLVELNNNFPYLITVSKLDISSFSGNTDYILIGLSLTLYSKKAK